ADAPDAKASASTAAPASALDRMVFQRLAAGGVALLVAQLAQPAHREAALGRELALERGDLVAAPAHERELAGQQPQRLREHLAAPGGPGVAVMPLLA